MVALHKKPRWLADWQILSHGILFLLWSSWDMSRDWSVWSLSWTSRSKKLAPTDSGDCIRDAGWKNCSKSPSQSCKAINQGPQLAWVSWFSQNIVPIFYFLPFFIMSGLNLKRLTARQYDFRKFNYDQRGKERAAYVAEWYKNQHRRDDLFSILNILCLLISIIASEKLFSMLFWTILIIHLIGYSISSKAFDFEVDKMDKRKFWENPYSRECRAVLTLKVALFITGFIYLLFII